MFELDYRIVHSEYDDFVGHMDSFRLNAMIIFMVKCIRRR